MDVDGVLNALNDHSMWSPAGLKSGRATSDNGTYTIKWAPELIDGLKALDLDLCWATTWRSTAASSIGPLIGWGEDSRWLTHDHGSLDRYGWSIDWKYPSVVADQKADPSPFLWVEDELEGWHMQWAEDAGGLAICPDPEFGITPEQLEEIREYVRKAEAEHNDGV